MKRFARIRRFARICQSIRTNRTLSGTSMWRPQWRYTLSRTECRIKFPQNQRCRAKTALYPPKSRCHTFLLSHFPLIRSRQGAKGGCLGGLVEGIAALLGSENGSRYRGVSQLLSHHSRYSVQLRSDHLSWKVNFRAWNLAIPYTTNPCPTLCPLKMVLFFGGGGFLLCRRHHLWICIPKGLLLGRVIVRFAFQKAAPLSLSLSLSLSPGAALFQENKGNKKQKNCVFDLQLTKHYVSQVSQEDKIPWVAYDPVISQKKKRNMLESYSFVHLLAFRELLVWPPRRILVCPPFWGPFSHYKNSFFFWGFLWWILVQTSVWGFPFSFSQSSHLFLAVLHFSNFPKPLLWKRPFLKKNAKSVFRKINTINIRFFEGCLFF